MKKRLLSLILALFMAVSLLPLSALAVEPEDPAEPVAIEETVPAETQETEEGTPPLQEEEEAVPEPEAAAEPEVEEAEPVRAAGEGEGTTTEPAPDAQVWMTVSNEGTLALARASVTVKDLDSDGKLTFDEALKAAHQAYCPGGYSGEWVSDDEYGDYYVVNKLWNAENGGAYLFYVNDVLGDSVEAQTVAAGDDLVAAVMEDTRYYSDLYSYFTTKTVAVKAGEEFELTLKAESYNSGTLTGAGLTVGTWSEGTFTPLEGKVTDVEGKVSLTFTEAGTYIVSAFGTVKDNVTIDWTTDETKEMDCPLTAPVCVITVEEAEQPAESGHIIVSFEMFDAETNTVALITNPEKVAFTAEDNGKTIAEKLLGAENVNIDGGWMKSFTVDDIEYSPEELGMENGSWLVYKNNAQDSVGPADYKPADGDVYRFVLTTYDPVTWAMPDMPNDLSALYWTVAEYTGNKQEAYALIQKEGGASQAEVDAMTASLATPGGSHYVFIDGRTIQVNTTTYPYTYFTTLTTDKRSAAAGATVTVTVTAPEGTSLMPGTLKANGTALTEGEENTYTFAMPDSHVTVTAEFAYTVKLLTAAFAYDAAGEEGIAITPAFDPDTYEYEIVLAENRLPKNSSTFYFTADFDESATAKWFVYMNMNGSGTYTGANAVTPGTPVALRKSNFLVYGNGERHRLDVTSAGGVVTSYYFRMTIVPTLADLKIDGETVEGFAPEKNEFTVTLPEYAESITLLASPTDDNNYVYFEGQTVDDDIADEDTAVAVQPGGNELKIVVDDENGHTNTYTLTVTVPERTVVIPEDAEFSGDISATANDHVVWWIKDGTLTIAGWGNMSTITNANAKKYDIYLHRDRFTKVVVQEGVTNIGNYRLSNLDFTEITLPESLTAIGTNALYMSKLFTELTVPGSVTSIGNSAFSSCSALQTVTLPASLTSIGNSAFSSCSALQAVTLPASLTSIGNSAFSSCSALQTITVPASVTSLGNSVFSGCTKLASVTFEDGEEPLTIGGSVFSQCKALTSMTFPNRTVSAGTALFDYCESLQTITISAGASGLAHGGISGGSLDSAPETVKIVVDPDSTHYRDTESGIIYIIDGESTTGILLVRKTVSGDVVVPEGVTEIDTNAFSARREITSVTLPSTVKTIGDMAFQNCDKLAAINLPEGLISFGHSAFAYSGLTEVTLPSTLELTSASHSAFSNCTKLETVTVNTANPLPTQTFQNCTVLKTLNLSAAVTEIDRYIYRGCDSLTTIHLDEGNTSFSLKDGILYTKDGKTLVFCPNGRTEDLVIPEGVEQIGQAAFYYCVKIENVTFPSTLKAIGEDGFCDAQALKKAVLPDSCVTLDPFTFQDCYALTEIRLGSGLTALPRYFAQNCESLESIEIPAAVTSIGERAFQNCKALTSANIPEGLTIIEPYTFQNCPIGGDLHIPEGVTEIGTYAFSGCEYVEDIYLPSTLTTLNNQWASGMIAHHIYFPGSDTQWTAVNKKNTVGYPATTEIILFYGMEADAPVIAVQPESVSAETGSAMTLSVTMEAPPEGKTMTVTWYSNTAKTTASGAKAVATTLSEDGLTATCTPPTTTPGGTYYYAVAYLTDADGVISKPAYSDIVTVAVLIDGFTGHGMEEEPYLLTTTDDIVLLRDKVNGGMEMSGLYFKMTADITLPAEWVPIGKTKNGSNDIQSGRNLNAFRGVFDGDGHTITVPAGEKPLFAYVRGAEIKNLNVYGEQIEGYGLINNMEGVGLSGTAVIVDNVTLKSGTKTLKSGITGGNITTNGFAGVSMSYETTIRNCTIEEGVVIGYDGTQSIIGSFVGRLQGTIENCVSYADVKGRFTVGGIIGCRDNAMGNCTVHNCEFRGTIECAEDFAGGIAGQNYTNCTAPNGVSVVIIGCTVEADITGGNNVGGILGGDQFTFQPWGDFVVRDNSFNGTLKATATEDVHVGGIVGYMACLNAHTLYTDNSYNYDCGAETGWGYVKSVDTDNARYATEDGTALGWTDGTFYYDSSKDVTAADAAVRVPENGGNLVVSKMDQQRHDDPLGTDADDLCRKIYKAPVIDSQTEEQIVKKGETVALQVAAEGEDLTYQWQYSRDGGTTWVDCKSAGYDAAAFSFRATAGLDGRLYRCLVTRGDATAESEPIPVKVSTLSITAQPKDAEVGKGQTIDMTVKASGKDLTYQWQYSKDSGETWVNCKSAGYDTAALSFKGTATMNGRQFRCVVTDGYGFTETSAGAQVKVSTTVITSSPADAVVTTGKKVTFKVTATGTDLTYQWQYSKNNGKTWVDCHSTGYDTVTLSFKVSATMNGRLFRCVVTGSDGIAVASGAGALTITDTAITAQPADVTVAAGKKATFKVTATGEDLTYQWQYSKNNGKTWIDCTSAGHDSATFSFKPGATLNGRLYRCIVTGSDGAALPSEAATLTVN